MRFSGNVFNFTTHHETFREFVQNLIKNRILVKKYIQRWRFWTYYLSFNLVQLFWPDFHRWICHSHHDCTGSKGNPYCVYYVSVPFCNYICSPFHDSTIGSESGNVRQFWPLGYVSQHIKYITKDASVYVSVLTLLTLLLTNFHQNYCIV